MRTLLLAIFFAFILMMTMLHAGAIKEEHEQKTKAKRYLLGESSLGRKGIGSDTNDQSMKGTSASANTNPADSGNNNKLGNKYGDNDKDGDNTNDGYQKYGNGSGPSLNSHHYFHIRTPPIHG
uniref:Uncharacterized protein n=1 Tax=Cajanus cajan TaxID=3821 RepID=A0A151RDC2_CAJCA|nr:hypothetical protein KK1_038184 [Cajanus cajan]